MVGDRRRGYHSQVGDAEDQAAHGTTAARGAAAEHDRGEHDGGRSEHEIEDKQARHAVALVSGSPGSLHAVIRAVMAEGGDPDGLIDRTVALTAAYVTEHRPHLRFLARERHGVRPVREAIAAELRRFADEVARGPAAQPRSAAWSPGDLHVPAELYVDHMVATAVAFPGIAPDDRAARERLVHAARLRMRIISAGRTHVHDAV